MNSKRCLVYPLLSKEFYFGLLTHYTFDVSFQSTGLVTACLEVTVLHRLLGWKRLPGWNVFSCASASFTLPKGEAFWIQLPSFQKKVSGLCILPPDSSFSVIQSNLCTPWLQHTDSRHLRYSHKLLFPNSTLQQCAGEKKLNNKIFICFCNFCSPFNYITPLVCWNNVNDTIIIVST